MKYFAAIKKDEVEVNALIWEDPKTYYYVEKQLTKQCIQPDPFTLKICVIYVHVLHVNA